MSDEDVKAELERLRNENAMLKKGAASGIRMKVSEKGATPTDVTQQSARSNFDGRSPRENYSLAATPAIPANSHRARASAMDLKRL